MRQVSDSLGTLDVPEASLYGANTARGAANFKGFGPTLADYPYFMRAMAGVKQAAARANQSVGALIDRHADAIADACDEIRDGAHWDQFIVPLAEGSGGTSTNMNFNEVIAARANQIMGLAQDAPGGVTANDHVNLAQSTNDCVPTGIKLACVLAWPALQEAAQLLIKALEAKGRETSDILRTGRTCMQAAQPMTYGQLFGGYASMVSRALQDVERAVHGLCTVPMGGTAIGTGLGAPEGYREVIEEALSESLGLEIECAANAFDGMQSADGFARMSAELRNLAAACAKIAADLVILSSDGASGIGEILLPAVQPGSSIMAGKVNPVMPMSIQQISMIVQGQDLTVSLAAQAGQMEINHFEPAMAQALFTQMALLTAGLPQFAESCIAGLKVDEARSYENLARSFAVSTVFLRALGYKKVAGLAKRAQLEGRSLSEIAAEEGLLDADQLRDVLRGATGA